MNELIVVLGNSSPITYNSRASHGLNLFLKKSQYNKNTFFLAKNYNNSWTLDHFIYAAENARDRILNNEFSYMYTNHKYTPDTITEAVGTRYVLEKMFYNNYLIDNFFKVKLTVVTSKCHEPRTTWIFREVFKDIEDWVELNFDSSVTTCLEISDNRYIKEFDILNAQQNKIKNYGGMVEYINKNFINKNIHFQFKIDYNFKNKKKYIIEFNDF